MYKDKVSMEEALNRAGFGLYSYLMICLAGLAIISFACVGYSSSILVPASACELETTAGQQGMLAAAPVFGSIVGGVIWGYLADKYGRRKMELVALIACSVANLVASISVNWIMLMIIQFFASLLASGLYTMSMSLLSESVPMVKRNFVVLLVTSIFLLSQGIMAVLSIPIIPLTFSFYLPALGIYWNSWRTLVLVYSLPGFITATCLFFMKESPKFIFAQGDEKQALEILKTIHRVNNCCSSMKELEVNSILKEKVKMTDEGTVEKQQSPVKQLFSQPHLKYIIIMSLLLMFQQVGPFLVWLPTIANQFVTIIQTGDGSDLSLCNIIQLSLDTPADPDEVPCSLNIVAMMIVFGVGALQSLINLCISLIVNYTGRRNIVFVVAVVCGAAGIVVNLVPNAIGSAVLFVIMLQFIISFGVYTAIIVAIFPTHLRALAIAIPMMAGRLMTFASIQIVNIMLINSCEAGFYLYSSLIASSAIVAAFLPDDRKLKPPAPARASSPPPPSYIAESSPKELNRSVSQL